MCFYTAVVVSATILGFVTFKGLALYREKNCLNAQAKWRKHVNLICDIIHDKHASVTNSCLQVLQKISQI